MNYGFVIDNDSCIGCHACSTACKSENEVPLGVQRTWVKSVETGLYPDVTRSFQVTRCNHCANPPCVRICPVTAMYQREDGIVEFDPSACIGCKACLQACPYDAIYIDPESGTAAKCHYCAHRVEVGMEPACVVVCPEHAIIAGDLDDPKSEISQVVASNKVTVRKPEQGTAPKLFYIGGSDAAMHPTATARTPDSFAWADVIPLHDGDHGSHAGGHGDGHGGSLPSVSSGRTARNGTPIRTSGAQGVPTGGPIAISGQMAEQMTQVVYNAQHAIPWHWPVPAYLVTKGIAAGIFSLLGFGWLAGLFAFDPVTFVAGGLISVVATLITTGLLVYDLEHPERFLWIVLRPQWKSWLVRGAYLLIGFATISGLWWAAETAALLEWIDPALAESLRAPAFWLGIPLAIGAAVYTAFLFGQAEGRDLWQSGLLPVHLMIQAIMAGSAALLVWDAVAALPADILSVTVWTFGISVAVDLLVIIFGEVMMPHASENAAQAGHAITHGAYRKRFWGLAIVLGHVLPLIALALPVPFVAALAAIAALVGLYHYEYCFVMAPQEIPNS